jgi:hypothetical protein
MIDHEEKPSLGLVAKELKTLCGGQTILIGPLRIWTDRKSGRDMYGVVVAGRDKSRRECIYNTMIFLGAVAAGEPPQWLMGAVDTVLLVKRADEITVSEGEKLRLDLIGLCRCYFKRVRTFDSERAYVEAMVKFFPGDKSERLRAAVLSDPDTV